jgi:hypothetical protein
MGADGFTWTGTLEETDIQSLYAACQSLRFSGKLELKEGANRAEVTFVGGEPIEIDGGDTQRIALWNKGTFRAVQSIPNLSGELTGQQDMEGSLAITKASQLWAWVSEYRLTCDIDLERPGSKAVVSFSNGHAESAQVNGAPELAALARVSSWTDGTFRVKLKPLFASGTIPTNAPAISLHEGAPPAGRQFDVSRSIPMDLKRHEPAAVRRESFGPAKPVQLTPPRGERVNTPSGRDEPTAQQKSPQLPELEGRKNKRRPFDPMDPSKPVPKTDEVDLRARRGKLPWLLSLGGIVLAGGLGALYAYHLPPFSPPPKPVTEPPAKPAEPPATTGTPGTTASPGTTATTGTTGTAGAAGSTGTATTVTTPAPNTKPPVEAQKPPVEAQKPTRPAEPEARKPETHKPETPKEKPSDKLVAKGRLFLVEGHARQALDQFRKAVKLAPKDASLRVLEQQAQGKLGRAELVLEGKGSVTVDGHKFASPKKLKVMAGPHVIENGDGEEEVALKRGEKRRIKVKK